VDDVDQPAVAVRPAATVVLLRDGTDGLEVWLQQRSSSLVFAGGMFAFPGGAVDSGDETHLDAPFDARTQAAVWGCSPQWARTLATAACRETAEEAGVELDPADLTPWARWITPIGPPRRFDAHFFVAPVPVDQRPRALTGEVAGAAWLVVTSAVERHLAGDLPMWPPTITTLGELAPHADVAAVLAAAPTRITAVTE
jgi:8-oxo-dGTP pyrophosphatase MutT (NUDIX family)